MSGWRNNMEIKFNKKIYSKKAIWKAAEDYNDLADFTIENNNKYIKIFLKNIKEDVKDDIYNEFCNHVLQLTKIK
jgi:hypothetical protein